MEVSEALEMFNVSDIAKESSGSLKKKYKRLMIKYHPDNRNGDSSKAVLVSDAYKELKDLLEVIESYAKKKQILDSMEETLETIIITSDQLDKVLSGKTVKIGNKDIDKSELKHYRVVVSSKVFVTVNGYKMEYIKSEIENYQHTYEVYCEVFVDSLKDSVPITIEAFDKKVETTLDTMSMEVTLKSPGGVRIKTTIIKKLGVE